MSDSTNAVPANNAEIIPSLKGYAAVLQRQLRVAQPVVNFDELHAFADRANPSDQVWARVRHEHAQLRGHVRRTYLDHAATLAAIDNDVA